MEINDLINKITCADCMDTLKQLPDKCIDVILCDLPYGTTACKWDTIIPFEPLWEQYKRITKDNSAIVLFGMEPFSSLLRCSNIEMFKYDWIYIKNKSSGWLNAKKQPLNSYEIISVFYNKQCIYNPQYEKAKKIYNRGFVKRKKSDCYGKEKDFTQEDNGFRYPKRTIYFNNNKTKEQLHPTQKPVALFEYLIKTYTNEGDLVLDNCSGSGTTAIACMHTKRRFICIEKDPEYWKASCKRLEDEQRQGTLF